MKLKCIKSVITTEGPDPKRIIHTAFTAGKVYEGYFMRSKLDLYLKDDFGEMHCIVHGDGKGNIEHDSWFDHHFEVLGEQ